jgi:hypothetical protein
MKEGHHQSTFLSTLSSAIWLAAILVILPGASRGRYGEGLPTAYYVATALTVGLLIFNRLIFALLSPKCCHKTVLVITSVLAFLSGCLLVCILAKFLGHSA